MPSSFFEFQLPSFPDPRGLLVPVELQEKIPFAIKRVYFLKNVPPDTTRGAHCHLLEEEVFVCVSGRCRARIDQDGAGKKDHWLDAADKAIYVGIKVWHEFDSFSPEAVLLAFSSTAYLPGSDNYVSDYQEFIALRKKIPL